MKSIRLIIGFVLSFVGSIAVDAGGQPAAPMSEDFVAILRSGDAAKLSSALNAGASAHARDSAGNTPLMHATVYGDLACVRLLLDRGADVNATNVGGASALLRAAPDYDKVALLIQKGANVNARSALGNTALMLAARPWDSHRTVALLIKSGADVNAKNNSGGTALMAAAAGGDVESVRMLIEKGADVNASSDASNPGFIFGGGRTPLMWASYRGDLASMKLLTDAGADVNLEGTLGTPLSQAAWADQTQAARLLMDRGAKVNQMAHGDGYAPLHWAASTEGKNTSLVKLLIERGADPNLGGGENVDAFRGTLQTPLMLAQRRGDTPVLAALTTAGATNATPDRATPTPPSRIVPDRLDSETVRAAIRRAIPPLQKTSLESKKSFVRHGSKQDCTSCHQQYLPLAAIGFAKRQQVPVDREAEEQLIAMVRSGAIKDPEADWQSLFHPEPVHSKGYELFGFAAEELPASVETDSWVHHLSVIQGKDGRWFNNLPRPPLQTGDIGATALAIHALQKYPLPGHKAEFAKQVDRARRWLWTVRPDNTEGRIYQILGLVWAGETREPLKPLTLALIAEQRADGGWSQLPGTRSDAYATGQAIYALHFGATPAARSAAIERGRRFLLTTQHEDGTWYVRRRAFPFQPTMDSGFPHGRDSWISASGTSWAVMALCLDEDLQTAAAR